MDAARAVATALGAVRHKELGIDLRAFGGSSLTSDTDVPRDRDLASTGIPSTYVPARNTIFLSLALGWAEVLGARQIVIGVNALDYSGYPDCRPEFVRAFEALGRAYLAFARAEPAHYAAMFEAHIQLDAHPGLLSASDRAFAILREAAERLTLTLPPDSRPPSLMMALHIWALSHGIASLFGRGDAARRALPMSPEELLEADVLVYLRGLGIGTSRTDRGR